MEKVQTVDENSIRTKVIFKLDMFTRVAKILGLLVFSKIFDKISCFNYY